METKIYLRIAKGGKGKPVVKASIKPDYSPLEGAKYWNKSHWIFYPTVSFALELDIPDEEFIKAEQVVAKLNIENDKITINDIIVSK